MKLWSSGRTMVCDRRILCDIPILSATVLIVQTADRFGVEVLPQSSSLGPRLELLMCKSSLDAAATVWPSTDQGAQARPDTASGVTFRQCSNRRCSATRQEVSGRSRAQTARPWSSFKTS